MRLKEKFIRYCELQRSANEYRERNGADHHTTITAYEEANIAKRDVLELIDEAVNNIEELERWQTAAFMVHSNLDLDIEFNREALAVLKGNKS